MQQLFVFTFCFSILLPAAAQAPKQLRVDGARIMQNLQALSEFGKNPQGGVSRVAYSEADLQGREYAMRLMREAQLDVHIDAAGNIVGSRAGSDASLKPLLIGSHIDSVPEGGNYDGDVVAAFRDRVNMGADQQRLKGSIAARARTHDISGSVNVYIKLRLAHQAHGILSALEVRLAVGHAANPSL